MRNKVQLITYADRLGGTISGTTEVVRDVFGTALGGVHILPFFTPFDGADAGFDPTDHTAVDPRLGSWDDVRELSRTHDTVVDVIVNHVSSSSAQFQDVVARGQDSPYASMFLTFDTVFPDGATEADLTAIYRPRPGLPFVPVSFGGQKKLAWVTFTPQQIDIDVHSAAGSAYLDSVVQALADANVTLIRLDAVGYAIKKAGDSCFMMPETFDFIDAFSAKARALGLEVLVEVHSYYKRQVEIAAKVDKVYDFALPPLVLHAFYAGDPAPLAAWLDVRPANAMTVLDTHDGIGVIDVGASDGEGGGPGLLEPHHIDALVEGIHERTKGQSRLATGAAASNLDIYQVNATFYAALGCDDSAYLAARCIQFFTPGVPQVYYVGALLGDNDMELLARTQVGRDINRHYYTREEIAAQVEKPAVKALLALMTFRNEHPAFDGVCEHSVHGSVLTIAWRHGEAFATMAVDVAAATTRLEWSTSSGTVVSDDLIAQPPVA